MSAPLCCVFIPEELSLGFYAIDGLFKGLGITKENPLSKTVFLFDESGEDFESSLSDFNGFLESGKINGVQFWIDEGHDIYIGWNIVDSGVEFRMYLDGLDNDIATYVLGELMKFIWIKYRHHYNEGKFFSIEII